MTPVRIKSQEYSFLLNIKIEGELNDSNDSKLQFLSQGFSHKLNLTLTQKVQEQDWILCCEGILRIGFTTSPIVTMAKYKFCDNQRLLETFDFEAPKFKYKESYKKTDTHQFDYSKNEVVTLLQEITPQIYEPLALILEMFRQGSKEPKSFDRKEFEVLVGGKVRSLRLEKSGSCYLGLVKEKKIFSVHKLEQEHEVTVRVHTLPFKPEIKITFN